MSKRKVETKSNIQLTKEKLQEKLQDEIRVWKEKFQQFQEMVKNTDHLGIQCFPSHYVTFVSGVHDGQYILSPRLVECKEMDEQKRSEIEECYRKSALETCKFGGTMLNNDWKEFELMRYENEDWYQTIQEERLEERLKRRRLEQQPSEAPVSPAPQTPLDTLYQPAMEDEYDQEARLQLQQEEEERKKQEEEERKEREEEERIQKEKNNVVEKEREQFQRKKKCLMNERYFINTIIRAYRKLN